MLLLLTLPSKVVLEGVAEPFSHLSVDASAFAAFSAGVSPLKSSSSFSQRRFFLLLFFFSCHPQMRPSDDLLLKEQQTLLLVLLRVGHRHRRASAGDGGEVGAVEDRLADGEVVGRRQAVLLADGLPGRGDRGGG